MRRWQRSARPHTSRAGACRWNRAGDCELLLLRVGRPSRCSRTRNPCATGKPRCRLLEQWGRRKVKGRVVTSGQAAVPP
eukprot:5402672-Pleurochrysis_carterae.AAC.1